MKISTSTMCITFLVYCFISGCDSSSSNNMDTTTIGAANNGSDTNNTTDSAIYSESIVFDSENYPGDKADYSNNNLTLSYPADWRAAYAGRDFSVLLIPPETEIPEGIWGTLDAPEKCTLRSEYFSDQTLESVVDIYTAGVNPVPQVEFLILNGQKAARIIRADGPVTQLVNGTEGYYYHGIRCSGIEEEERNLIMDSVTLTEST